MSVAEVRPSSISIKNIGPIIDLEIPAKPGTIAVLRGSNGSGKSTALSAVQAVATKSGSRLQQRDGTIGGHVTACGCTIKVARNGANRRLGDLEVTSIEDQVNVADLVDPHIKDPVAADARRLKALTLLVGAEVTEEQLWGLVGSESEFREIVRKESTETGDIVELLDRVKRDIEAAARLKETAAEEAWSQCKAIRDHLPADLSAPHDETELGTALETAIANRAAILNQKAQASKSIAAIVVAKDRLEQLQNAAHTSIDVARQESADADAELRAAHNTMAELEHQLQLAIAGYNDAVRRAKAAAANLVAAENHSNALVEATKAATADCVAMPTEAEIAAAELAVTQAREAANHGAIIRDALKKAAEADKHEERAKVRRERAAELRAAAGGTLKLLADAVRGLHDSVTVDDEFRIRVKHEARGECYFAELSHGEKWSLALQLVVEAFRRRNQQGLLAIPQEAWEGLDGANRTLVLDAVRSSGLIVLTAEASRDSSEELCVSVLE